METQIREVIVQLYKELNIPDEVPEEVLTAWLDAGIESPDPIFQIYNKIYEAVATYPIKYKNITDKIADDKVLRICFDEQTRNNLSKLYPDDEELALKLTIQTASYYKVKYHPVYETCSWEDDDCDRQWRLITHCPDVYFTLRFEKTYRDNPAIMRIMDKYQIKEVSAGAYNINPKLMELWSQGQQ